MKTMRQSSESDRSSTEPTEAVLEGYLRKYLELEGRGAATELCINTSLSASEVSNWLAKRRALASPKLVEAIGWLVSSGKMSITFNL